jgi:LPS export ABC transporter protein LptC
MIKSFTDSLKTIFHRRNLVISSLLFVIVVIQVIVLLPNDLELQDKGPVAEEAANRAKKKRRLDTKASKKPMGGLVADTGSGQVIRGVHSVEVNADGKGWELWAEKGVRPKDSGEWSIEAVRVKFYASNGVSYVVTGKRGGVNPATYDLWIKGDVVTLSSNGYRFESPAVSYNSKLKRILAPDLVEMIGPKDAEGSRLELTGVEMTADLNTNEIKIGRRVKASKRVNSTRSAQIQSNHALFSGASNLAAFMGGVVIDVESMRITGPEARFVYDPGRDSLESVLVAGGVKVTDQDKFATSGTLSVNFKEDRYVFRGSPRVRQNDDELMGDEIVFLQGGKQVQVINARAQVDPARANGNGAGSGAGSGGKKQ